MALGLEALSLTLLMLWPRDFLVLLAVLCMIGSLAASLVSTL